VCGRFRAVACAAVRARRAGRRHAGSARWQGDIEGLCLGRITNETFGATLVTELDAERGGAGIRACQRYPDFNRSVIDLDTAESLIVLEITGRELGSLQCDASSSVQFDAELVAVEVITVLYVPAREQRCAIGAGAHAGTEGAFHREKFVVTAVETEGAIQSTGALVAAGVALVWAGSVSSAVCVCGG